LGGKRIDRSAHIGDHGIALIHKRVAEMGLVWHERRVDAGIDGVIELRDPGTGEVANRSVLVQSKATEGRFPGENDECLHFLCNERDLDYWMRADRPVLLICSHPSTGEAWWAHVQAWFRDPARRASRRIDIDKATQAFDASAAARLFAIADPTGIAHTPVADARAETLVSNLLPVEPPVTLYSCSVQVDGAAEVWALLRPSGQPRGDWLLHGGRLLSFADPLTMGLAEVVTGQVHLDHPTGYASGDAERQRRVVQLLNKTLRDDLRRDLEWHHEQQYLYFRGPRALRTVRVPGPHGRGREVFSVHRNQAKGHVKYCKHMALRWRFHLIGEEWVLDLSPDYHYTRDGVNDSRWASEARSGLKRLEKHVAVRGQVEFWAHYLRPEDDALLETHERRLTFGPPLRFTVDAGIDDEAWTAHRRVHARGPAPRPDHSFLELEGLM
jgi:hypothetical protein